MTREEVLGDKGRPTVIAELCASVIHSLSSQNAFPTLSSQNFALAKYQGSRNDKDRPPIKSGVVKVN